MGILRRPLALLAAAVVAAGCSSAGGGPGAAATQLPGSTVWSGSWTTRGAGGGNGSVTLETLQDGNLILGRLTLAGSSCAALAAYPGVSLQGGGNFRGGALDLESDNKDANFSVLGSTDASGHSLSAELHVNCSGESSSGSLTATAAGAAAAPTAAGDQVPPTASARAGGAPGGICQLMQWGEPAYLALTSRFGPVDNRSIQPTQNHYEWYFTNGTPSAQDVREVLTSLRLSADVSIGSDAGGNQFVIIDLGNGGCPAS